MESSVSEGIHGTARSSKASRPMSTVAGLSMNKHGLSMNTLRSQRPQQVYVALPPPPLNINSNNNNTNVSPIRKHSLDSKTSAPHSFSSSPLASPPNDYNTTPRDCLPSCQTILFATSTLHQSIKQCIRTSSCPDGAPFLTTLSHQLHHAHDQLESATTSDVLPLMNLCISTLRDTCTQLHARRDELAMILDQKSLRHLLLTIYGVTIDLKEGCESMTPPPPATTRHRSHSEHHLTPNGATPSSLYTHLKMAVSSSAHLVEVLNQSMVSLGLEQKLAVLDQPIQQAMACTHQLNQHLEDPSYTIQFWEDTNLFLKTFVSLMSLIRSLSTEDEVNWPKSVKQGCLHLTRVTAEIAKLWNNDPKPTSDDSTLPPLSSCLPPAKPTSASFLIPPKQ